MKTSDWTPVHAEPDPLVLQRAVSGDRNAQGAVAALYYPRLRRWALLETRSPDQADEAVQEALVRWIRFAHTYQIGTRFSVWMRTLVRNAARDVRRPKRVLDLLPWRQRRASMERQLDLHRAASRALSCLEELTPRQRDVLDFVDLQGRTAVDAALELGIRPETARVHLHEARKRLAEALDSADHALVREEA